VGIGNKVVSRPIAVVAVVIGAVAGLEVRLTKIIIWAGNPDGRDPHVLEVLHFVYDALPVTAEVVIYVCSGRVI